MKLYGLKSCDTCRKALKELRAAGLEPRFIDLRANALSAPQIERFYKCLGADLVNRRSTTWRGLADSEKTGGVCEMLANHPTLMKRPVIDTGKQLLLGWDAETRGVLLG